MATPVMDNSVQMPVRVLWKDIGGCCHGNKLWFVHRDRLAEHRYSDGAQLCVVPQLEGRSSGWGVGLGGVGRVGRPHLLLL